MAEISAAAAAAEAVAPRVSLAASASSSCRVDRDGRTEATEGAGLAAARGKIPGAPIGAERRASASAREGSEGWAEEEEEGGGCGAAEAAAAAAPLVACRCSFPGSCGARLGIRAAKPSPRSDGFVGEGEEDGEADDDGERERLPLLSWCEGVTG
jgi:hypothetical protein